MHVTSARRRQEKSTLQKKERFKDMKRTGEVPTSVDLVCQKHQFESKEDKDIKYYVLHIIETTDKELEPFIGKCNYEGQYSRISLDIH